MIYSTGSNSLSKQDTTAPGVVLAVSPNDSQLLVNDQARHLFYLYNASAGSSSVGSVASFVSTGRDCLATKSFR